MSLRTAQRWLLALLSTAGALAGAELGLRALRPEVVSVRDMDWQVRTRAMHARLHQPDAALVYVPRPGTQVAQDYGPAAYNDAGLRAAGPTPTARAPETRERIAVLGDSLVWGDLLALEDTLPARLAAHLGDGTEVLNFGVTGYDTVQERGWYQRRVRDFRPDVVVVVYCLNDMQIASNPYALYADGTARAALLAERQWLEAVAPIRNETVSRAWLQARRGGGLQIWAAVQHAWRWNRLFTLPGGYIDEYLLAARSPERSGRTLAALRALGQDIRADGAEARLVISPGLYWWHRYPWRELHAAVRAAAEAGGFAVLDPLAAWQQQGIQPEVLRFAGDNVHYTPEGAEILAATVAAWLSAP